MKVTDVIRWVCVVPAGIAGWYVALIFGMLLLSLLNDWCPYGEVVSGLCYAPWYEYVDKTIIPVFAGLSAALVVLMASWVAPTKKTMVAIVTYASGGIVAVSMAVKLGSWVELTAAMGAGVLMVFLVYRRQSARTIA